MTHRTDPGDHQVVPGAGLYDDTLRGEQPGSEARTIHVRLTPAEHWELRRRANAAGIRPWDLARHWLVAQLDRPEDVQDNDLSYEIHDLTGLVMEQREAINQLHRRLERLELTAGRGTLAFSPDRVRLASGAGAHQPAMGPHPKLHEEILAVLHESPEPLTSEAIAEAVTRRGRYQPRSGHAISPAAVSGRIANPRYRSLFRRDGRLISPAAR